MAEENTKKDNPVDVIDDEGLRLIKKQIDDFSKHLKNGNPSEILLKGHLLVENYLNHVMLIVLDKKAKINRKSFYDKVAELKDKNCFPDHNNIIDCLYALNKVRNELAHQLDFEVTLSQIDSIGYNLGKEYILRRYAKDLDEKELLLWVMDQVLFNVYIPIYAAMISEHEKRIKKDDTKTETTVSSEGKSK